MMSLPTATPGYYYAIAYTMAILAIVINKKLRYKAVLAAGIFTAMFGILLTFMIYTNGIRRELFPFCMGIIVILLFINLYLMCEFSIWEAGLYCAVAFLCGEFAASFSWQLYDYMISKMQWQPALWKEGAEILVVYSLIFMMMLWLEKRLKKGIEEVTITAREMVLAAMIVAVAFVVSNLSYLDTNGLFSGGMLKDIYIIRSLVDLCGVAILYAFRLQIKEVQIQLEKTTLSNIMQMQYQNYKISKESMDLVNQKYHDLKHQIVLLKNQTESGKVKDYLNQMEKEVRVYETQNRTGNEVLDAVLTSKSMYCQNRGIELKYMVEGEALSFMSDMDISSLFGNILDNAIESAENQKDQAKRLVGLYIQKDRQFVKIRCENYCEERLSFRNGMPVTTKKDKDIHGFGMKSICSTVEKYNGSAMARQEQNWFRLNILIPMK